MEIALLGFDTEGKASFEYFSAQGHRLTICDQNPDVQVPEGVESVLGEAYLDNLDRFDLVVRTAGLHPRLILEKNPGLESKITSHMNEFYKASPTKHIIGVTGTKGKGTTSTLIAKMLESAGKDVRLGGNIGLPPLTFINQLSPDSWVVLESSSFQLIDLQASPHIAVCLMVVPEHLNWHKDMDEYLAAKSRLFARQTSDDRAIYFEGNELSRQIASHGEGQKIPYFAAPGAYVEAGKVTIAGQIVCATDDLKLLGQHNWQNVCAAITAVWQVTQDLNAIRTAATDFSGLEHRLEFVRELDGATYYDDSFGTTPETAAVAIQAFTRPEIIILGGRGKGVSFTNLAEMIAERPNIKQVLAIGEAGPEITAELKAQGFTGITKGANDINGIVRQARALAAPGDVVLLSPACTSFDMFKNYKERGELFTKAVRALE